MKTRDEPFQRDGEINFGKNVAIGFRFVFLRFNSRSIYLKIFGKNAASNFPGNR